MKILVTGAAGYVGSTVVRKILSSGHDVVGYDNLSFGGEALLGVYAHPRFQFVKGDIRDEELLFSVLCDVDAVVHLAAIVGDPACAEDPKLATSVNLDGSIGVFNQSKSAGVQRFVFISTCSNYGKMSDEQEYVTEQSPLAPVSLYAELKVKAEQYILNKELAMDDFSPTVLRFATAYGLSARPRFDLTVNEFTKELALGRTLLVFGEQFWRPYCHVEDLAAAIETVLLAPKKTVAYNVYNVGDTTENYQKGTIVHEVNKVVKDAQVEYVKKDEDPRNYKVSFSKINKQLNFNITKRVPDGIREIYNIIKHSVLHNPDDPKYRNLQ
jgi:nucleoside-diphosphate-sugar epimerase